MTRFFLITAILLTVFATSMSYGLRYEIGQKLQTADTNDDKIAIVKEYTPKTEDVGILRRLQGIWLGIDAQECRDYFYDLHQQNPDSATYHYLWARVKADSFDRHQEALNIIKKYPDFNYGYHMLAYLYNHYLFIEDPNNPVDPSKLERLRNSFRNNKEHLLKWVEKFPDNDNALYTIYSMNLWEENYKEAEKYLLMTKDIDSYWAGFQTLIDFSKKSNRIDAFEILFPQIINDGIQEGSISQADSLSLYGNYYTYVLREIGEWDRLDTFLKDHPQLSGEKLIQEAQVDLSILKENYEEAIDHLQRMVNSGNTNYRSIIAEDKWKILEDTNNWDELINTARSKWEQGYKERKKATLSNKRDTIAPLWELKDFNGKLHRLRDYQGQIVIMNFWSTWSVPSLKTLEVINKWMQNMPENVQVFSINIAEEEPQEAVRYFTSNDFNMIPIEGTDELTILFGIRNVPYIIVTDQKGIIRFSHAGISDFLSEKLSWWVEDLLDS